MKVILTILLIGFLNANAQKKDTARVDSVKAIVIVLKETDATEVVNIIKALDEKPSVIQDIINRIFGSVQYINIPNREAKK